MQLTVDTETPVESMTEAQLITKWYEADRALDAIKGRELELRKAVFAKSFPAPTEGSKENKRPLSDGWILQGDYKINRSVDEAVARALLQGDNTRPLVEQLVKWKPDLILPEWRKVSGNIEVLKVIGGLVVEKPGTPALEIKLPKR